jgi:hypothetical protein
MATAKKWRHKFIVELTDIDWSLLKEQKRWLVEQPGEHAEGLINLIDYIQDAAEEQGQPVVWLDEGGTDVYAGCLERRDD